MQLDFSDNLGMLRWATAVADCVEGTCKVTCRTVSFSSCEMVSILALMPSQLPQGWTETSGHCSITADNVVFNDYCCGGSIADEKGCFCKAGQKVDGEGKCVD